MGVGDHLYHRVETGRSISLQPGVAPLLLRKLGVNVIVKGFSIVERHGFYRFALHRKRRVNTFKELGTISSG